MPCTRSPSTFVDKVDSGRAAVASSGALQNLTSYINGTFINLSNVFQESNEYISETLGVPPSVVYGSIAALLAVPITMSRFGWSLSREASSPYSSMSGGVPNVTEADYSYITSQDLDSHLGASGERPYRRSPARVPESQDDILLIKHKGVTYPAHFPPYSISDRKLQVSDVRKRIGLMMGLSDRRTEHTKLLYRGKQLKDSLAPVADYEVKNNSELMAIVPEGDIVFDGSENEGEREDHKTRRRKKKRSSKKSGRGANGDDSSSTRDSASNAEQPSSSGAPVGSASMKKLADLSREFNETYLPMCKSYIESPPSDPKKRDDEHRKLSETLLQHIILKTDGVETEGNPEIRTKRKALVRDVQDLLKQLDAAKAS